MRTVHVIRIKDHRENGKYECGTDRLVFTDKSLMDAWLAGYRKDHPSVKDEHIESWSKDLKANEHLYKVYINDSNFVTDHHAMITVARSDGGARRKGQAYMRAWDLSGQRIVKVEEVA